MHRITISHKGMLEPDKEKLRRNLERDFVGNTSWPPDSAALIALVDLGLSDDRIARYFRVSAADVTTLRRAYGLPMTTKA